jgi:tRNA A37 threonylcarbamoyladenosine dehydratase
MLARAGVGKLTLVDADTVNLSNRNRQLNALSSTMGRQKVHVTGERLLDINPDLQLRMVAEFIPEDRMEALLTEEHYDFVVDAIDSLTPKVHLIYNACKQKIPIVSAMGAGGKTNPELVRQVDLSKTFQCTLARAVRRELGYLGVRKGIPVVFSSELVNKDAVLRISNERNKKSTVGTISFMPVVFGCHLAAYVINKLISSQSL